MKDLSDALQGKFFALVQRLEPENLTMDGEASQAEVKQRTTFLMKQWEDLEYLVGRDVSEDEIWDRQYAKYRKV
tara:strand:- start:2245 stop:2466 length:222 start_codon:yes stop_codon:yes gene_type:complete